ncbi:MAG: hypothetical protein ACAI35_10205 [Candidatus Methylacidiphilales bacterium]|nr:hypothetical protein [Candidatus Methylacidiphilales bacterium]
MATYCTIFTDESVLTTEAESVELTDGCLIFKDADGSPVAFANRDVVKASYVEGLNSSYEEAGYDDDEEEDEDEEEEDERR